MAKSINPNVGKVAPKVNIPTTKMPGGKTKGFEQIKPPPPPPTKKK